MKKASLFLSAAFAATLCACGSSEPTAEATATPAADPMADVAALETPAAPTTAQGFVDAAAASDMFEIESSKLAAATAKDAAVREFAEMMVTDHTKSSNELKAAAGQATPPLTVTPTLTAAQQADLDALKAAGADFDRLYAQKQVAAHEKALALLQSYASNGDSAPLKDFAAKTATVVSGHLDHARRLPQ